MGRRCSAVAAATDQLHNNRKNAKAPHRRGSSPPPAVPAPRARRTLSIPSAPALPCAAADGASSDGDAAPEPAKPTATRATQSKTYFVLLVRRDASPRTRRRLIDDDDAPTAARGSPTDGGRAPARPPPGGGGSVRFTQFAVPVAGVGYFLSKGGADSNAGECGEPGEKPRTGSQSPPHSPRVRRQPPDSGQRAVATGPQQQRQRLVAQIADAKAELARYSGGAGEHQLRLAPESKNAAKLYDGKAAAARAALTQLKERLVDMDDDGDDDEEVPQAPHTGSKEANAIFKGQLPKAALVDMQCDATFAHGHRGCHVTEAVGKAWLDAGTLEESLSTTMSTELGDQQEEMQQRRKDTGRSIHRVWSPVELQLKSTQGTLVRGAPLTREGTVAREATGKSLGSRGKSSGIKVAKGDSHITHRGTGKEADSGSKFGAKQEQEQVQESNE
eukprot:gene6776-34425_t